MKKHLKNRSSQVLIETNLIRSIKRVFLRSERINSTESSLSPINEQSHKKSNQSISTTNSKKPMHSFQSSRLMKSSSKSSSKSSNENFKLNNSKIQANYEVSFPNKEHSLQENIEETKRKKLLNISLLNEKETILKKYKQEIDKKAKEIH